MKRIGNLYNKVISVENLREADEKARKGKTNTYGVKVHDKNREANILALHEALLTKTFKASPYDVFTIFEPKGIISVYATCKSHIYNIDALPVYIWC